ncbi:DNA repair protein RecN [Clostridium bornimense]|uniref:DNA repair protein RecN n=1 Tax=Clostridium bornimense TaxID=1216932 RepID=UPI001C106B34|nr:DNA repair protein RecN [Clostridium bornimense]MBU5315836.1 DNA repair protein RecN [Clostridium bornimense]
MLVQLNISNFALIDNLSINFDKGFNVLTGETGTGKSILIDAISYILGGKYNRGIIRNGEERVFVEGVFEVSNNKSIKILEKLNIPVEESIIISRETLSEGRSVAKINNRTVTLSQLRELGETILNIHGQHENISLLNTNLHINYLDDFGNDEFQETLKIYHKEFDKFKNLKKRLEELQNSEDGSEKMKDFISYQIDEIEKAKLKIGEDLELEEKVALLSNSENMTKTFLSVNNILKESSEERLSVLDSLNIVVRELRSLNSPSEELNKIIASIEDSYYSIQDNANAIRDIKDSLVYDEDELNYLNSRLFLIDSLKRKYGETVEKIIDTKEQLEKQYYDICNKNEIIDKIKKEIEDQHNLLIKLSSEISEIRNNLARTLEDNIHMQLRELGLEKARFSIEVLFDEKYLSNKGCNKVTFKISTNPGEPLYSIDKVVSGGELSRIMLALKVVFTNKDKIPTIIFDEIDIGISGSIASAVAKKMFYVSLDTQVFVVTHLPQIAVMSDNHFVVTKEVRDEKTYSYVNKLKEEEKINEIARMIGGSDLTKLTIENARELVNLANDIKMEIKKE